MQRNQKTIRNTVSVSGIGLHTGVKSTVTFKPAPANSGIKFVLTDVEGCPEIPADIDHVVDISRGTTIAQDGYKVHTVEHVLAAVAGLEIDNLLIEVDNIEPPVCDGSAMEFVKALKRAEIVELEEKRNILVIDKIITYTDPENRVDIHVLPADDFRITFLIDYKYPGIGTQYSSMYSLQEEFEIDYAAARTFCFLSEVIYLKERGLIKGGSLSNALVFADKELTDVEMKKIKELFNLSEDLVVGPNGVVGSSDLRYYNEPVRHKILDLIGDLALLGVPIQGHVIAARSGHAHNVNLVKKIKKEYEKQLIKQKYQKEKIEGALFDIGTIESILPHRYPFLMVDRIIDMVPKEHVIALKNVTVNEPYFVGHFPVRKIMPGVLIIEALAQAGAFLLLNTIDNPEKKLAYFAAIDNVKFRKPVIPGDQLRLEVKLLNYKLSMCKMHGQAFVDGDLAAEAVMIASIVDRK